MIRLRAFVAVFVSVVATCFLGEWLYFRATHVVAAYAFVKGRVVEVGAPVEGQVIAVEVLAGQRVRAGDVLVRFNDLLQRAALERARAGLDEAKLLVDVERAQVRVLYQEADITSGQALARLEVSRAEARVANIDADLAQQRERRTSVLREKDMIPLEESETSAAASRVAMGKAEQARGRVAVAESQLGNARLQQARAKARESRLALLEAAAITAEAEVRAAEAELALCVVRAASDGVVSRRLVEPGSAVRVGGSLLELWYDEELAIEAWIDESKYGTLAPDAIAHATLSGLDHEVFDGRLKWLGVVTEAELKDASFSIPVAKKLAQSRWVRAQIVLDRLDPRLLPGLTAEVSIPRSWSAQQLLVPPDPPPPVPAVTSSSAASDPSSVPIRLEPVSSSSGQPGAGTKTK